MKSMSSKSQKKKSANSVRSKKQVRPKTLLEWLLIGLFALVVIAIVSVGSYRLYLGTDFATSREIKTNFLAAKEKLTDPELIGYCEIERSGVSYTETYYGNTADLFSDMKCVKYSTVSTERERTITETADCVVVYLVDDSAFEFYVMEDGKIYWNGSTEVQSKRFSEWYADFYE